MGKTWGSFGRPFHAPAARTRAHGAQRGRNEPDAGFTLPPRPTGEQAPTCYKKPT
jgi:hypothetical protein